MPTDDSSRTLSPDALHRDPAVRVLADAMPSFMAYVDSSFRYRLVNRVYRDRLGLDPEEILGKTIDEIWGERANVIRPNLQRAFAGELLTIEFMFGDVGVINTYVPHRDASGEVVGSWTFTQDVTELQRSRAALIQAEKMASLGRLVAGLLHELNTPVGAVRASAESLGTLAARAEREIAAMPEPAVTSGLKRCVAALSDIAAVNADAVERIRGLLERLRAFSQVDQAELQVADIHASIDNVVALTQHLRGEHIELVRTYGDLPPITCRPGELNQAFMHLLTNAMVAVGERGRIEIITEQRAGEARVSVRDNGCGIDEQLRTHLFTPTFQGGERVKTGIGLFVTQNIVTRHGGRIELESAPGEGSTFTVVLPIRAPLESA
ncbi:MAG: PAS domain-containing protein [Myxococcales bacterium]|nr:PAS domain-containing protein [Myxococcales bacterium]